MTQSIAIWTNMIPALTPLVLSLGDSLPAAIVFKATVALAFGLIAAWLARRCRAAVRHAMLAAVFGVLLLLPLTAAFAPPIRIVIRAKREAVIPIAAAPVMATPISAAPTRPLPPNSSPLDLLLTAYLAGAGLFLLPVIVGLWQVRQLRRSAIP